MRDDRYEKEFREFLLKKLELFKAGYDIPWIQATQDPLINGYGKPFTGVNLMLLTDYCRVNNIRQRMFCTYQQREEFGFPVRHNETGFRYLKNDNEYQYLFPCHIRGNQLIKNLAMVEEKRRELIVKLREMARQTGFSMDNENFYGRMMYLSALEKQPLRNTIGKLRAETISTIVLARLGISKTIDEDNMSLVDDMIATVKNEDVDMSTLIGSVNHWAKQIVSNIDKIELNERMYRDNIEKSVMNIKREEPKKIRLEELKNFSIKR